MDVYDQSRASTPGYAIAVTTSRDQQSAGRRRDRGTTEAPTTMLRPLYPRAVHSIDNSAVSDEQLFASFLELYAPRTIGATIARTWVSAESCRNVVPPDTVLRIEAY